MPSTPVDAWAQRSHRLAAWLSRIALGDRQAFAALYREIDVPVHPVATNAGVHWPKHGFMRKPGTIVFEYLEPIAPGLTRAEFMRLLQDRIETASTKLLTL